MLEANPGKRGVMRAAMGSSLILAPAFLLIGFLVFFHSVPSRESLTEVSGTAEEVRPGWSSFSVGNLSGLIKPHPTTISLTTNQVQSRHPVYKIICVGKLPFRDIADDQVLAQLVKHTIRAEVKASKTGDSCDFIYELYAGDKAVFTYDEARAAIAHSNHITGGVFLVLGGLALTLCLIMRARLAKPD